MHHLIGDPIGGFRPGVDHLVVFLALCDQAVVVLLLEFLRVGASLGDDIPFAGGHHHVVLAERNARLEGVMEAERHDPVAEDDRLLLPAVAVDLIDHARDLPLGHELVHDVEGDLRAAREHLAEHHAAGRSIESLADRLAFLVHPDPSVADLRVKVDDLAVQRVLDLGHVAEHLEMLLLVVALAHDREVIEAEHDILRRYDDGRAVRGMQDIVRRHHQHARLKLRFERKRHVHGHLIAVEIGIECRAHQRMELDRLAFDQHRLERLDAEAVQRRRAVEQHRMLADDLVENIPDLRLFLFDQLFRLLDRGGEALGVEARIDERLEQFERHLLRQAALMQLELGADDDHRAAGIVHPFAQQILPEATLLALEHVGERLQRPLVGAGDDAAATTIIEQRIDRLLQHALFVADDDVGRAQLDQPLQSIVPVDDAAIEVVEIGGGEAAAVERNKRPKIRRDYRHLRQNHPFRLIARLLEGFDDLEALGHFLLLRVGIRPGYFRPQIGLHLVEIERLEHLADGLRADGGGEAVGSELVLRLEILVLAQQLAVLKRSEPRFEHDIALEIEDALERLERHVEQEPDARRQRLEEPDMRDGGGQLDVAHALAPHARERDLDRALFTYDALVLHALVLAAQAFIVLDRAENACAEHTVALRLEGAIVDGLRLFDLSVGP